MDKKDSLVQIEHRETIAVDFLHKISWKVWMPFMQFHSGRPSRRRSIPPLRYRQRSQIKRFVLCTRFTQVLQLAVQVTLSDCLNLFLQEEQLGEDDPWYCNRCKKHQQAYKKFDLWTVPDILVVRAAYSFAAPSVFIRLLLSSSQAQVHLKRFQYSAHYRDKIDTLIEFPLDNLDLREYCRSGQQDAIFDLFAVSVC